MSIEITRELRQAMASADLFALHTAAFAFPTEQLAQALVDGSFKKDCVDCLGELGADPVACEDTAAAITKLESLNEDGTLYSDLRIEYSRLFLVVGRYTKIFPYEAAFLHVHEGHESLPSLFLAPRTLDVEKRMRRVNALPDNSNTEPVDSIFCEFDFMRLLYTSLANDLQLKNTEGAQIWRQELAEFRTTHIDAWVPAFMQTTIAQAKLPVYEVLAECVLQTLDLIPTE